MFRAVFLSQSPLVAAFYAGCNGIVHGYGLPENLRLIDATDQARMTSDEIRALDTYCSGRVAGGFLRLAEPYFPRGTTIWDHVLLVLGLAPELGVRAIKALGYDGFVRDERTGWARGDRSLHATHSGTAFDDVIDRISSACSASHRVTGIIDPSVLMPTVSLTAIDVSERLRSFQLDSCLGRDGQRLSLAA